MHHQKNAMSSMKHNKENNSSLSSYNNSLGYGSASSLMQSTAIDGNITANNIQQNTYEGSASGSSQIALSSQQKSMFLSQNTIIRPNDILLYINSFNITDSDPRNIITITYSFNNYTVNSLNIFQSTGIESLIGNILNLNSNLVNATNLINDVNNNTIVTFKLIYSQLSQSTAAMSNIDATLQLPSNAKLIYSVLIGCNSFVIIGKPTQGDASQLNTTYWCSLNTWCDFMNKNIKFNIKGQNIPTSITTANGLGINNIQLFGPSSNIISNASNNYILNSFTIVFFMKFNSLSFANGNSIIWYQMYAETPNMIRLAIYQIMNQNIPDPNFSIVEVIIGDQNTNYRWTIPNSTLMSNGYVSLYTFQYDADNSVCNFYIGTTMYTANLEVDTANPIVLSITPIAINKGAQSLDAQLYAFIYYNAVLSTTDLNALTQYCQIELGGIPILQKNNLQAIAYIQKLQSEIQNTQNNISSCQQEIGCSDCANGSIATKTITVPPSQPPIPPNPWVVNYNTTYDTNKTLESKLSECGPLQINEFTFGKGSKRGQESAPILSYKPINIEGPPQAQNTRSRGSR